MTYVYQKEDYAVALKSKNGILKGFFISLAILLAINIAIFIIYTQQEYKTELKLPLMLANVISCSIYAIIMFFIFAVKYKRVASYVKMLRDMQQGIRVEGVNAYVRTDSSITVKDGVEFISLVFLQWSEKRQEFFERVIYYDLEKQLPDFAKGDVIKHITHANILIAYELASTQIFE